MSVFTPYAIECHTCGLITTDRVSFAYISDECPYCHDELALGPKLEEYQAFDREEAVFKRYIAGNTTKEKLYQKRKQSEQRQAEAQLAKREAQRAAQANACVPKCPTCGSTNVQRISTASRLGSTMLFGLASSKIGKTMECKNCGYKW